MGLFRPSDIRDLVAEISEGSGYRYHLILSNLLYSLIVSKEILSHENTFSAILLAFCEISEKSVFSDVTDIKALATPFASVEQLQPQRCSEIKPPSVVPSVTKQGIP